MTQLNHEAAAASATSDVTRNAFFFHSAVWMLACVVLSFPLTYYVPLATGAREFPVIVHIHGAVYFSWMILYVWQSWLVSTKQVARHREFGLAGIALSTLIVPLGIAAAIVAAERRSAGGSAQPFATTFYNVVDITLFAVFMVASIACVTRQREWHRRFTFAAGLCLVGPAISRWIVPYISLPPYSDFAPNILADLFLVALAIHDKRKNGRIHAATLTAAAVMVPIHLISPAVSVSQTWNEMAPAIRLLAP